MIIHVEYIYYYLLIISRVGTAHEFNSIPTNNKLYNNMVKSEAEGG